MKLRNKKLLIGAYLYQSAALLLTATKRDKFLTLPLSVGLARPVIRRSNAVRLSNESNESKNKTGYYRRPSAAIEQGGGFFIPGLEGSKLKMFVGTLILASLALNRYPGYDVEQAQLRSEVAGVLCGIIFILQSLLEKISEDVAKNRIEVYEDSNETDDDDKSNVGQAYILKYDSERTDLQRIDGTLPENVAACFQKIGESILANTSACSVLILSEDKRVLGRLGLFDKNEATKCPSLYGRSVPISYIDRDDRMMSLLPAKCARALLVDGSSYALLVGTTSKRKGAFSSLDVSWIQKYAYLLNIQ